MADSSSVDDILEFLRRNKFTKAEAALKSELGNRPDLNGILQKLKLDDKESGSSSSEEANGAKVLEEDQKIKSSRSSGEGLKDSSSAEASKELIVKEVECGTARNGAENKWKSRGNIGEQSMVDASVGTSDKNFTFSKSSDDTVLDLYSWKYSTGNGPVPSYKNDDGSVDENNFLGFQVSSKTKSNSAEALNSVFSGQKRMTWPGTISMVGAEPEHERSEKSEVKEVDQKRKASGACSKDDLADDPWSRSNVSAPSASELWKDCSVKTVFPFSVGDTSTSYDSAAAIIDKKEGKRKAEFNEIRAAIKNQVDEVGRALYFGKTQGGEPKDLGALEFHLASDNQKEDLPRLPPVKLKSEDKSFNIQWEEKYERDGPGPKILNSDNAYLIGSFLDVPIGREINPSGKRPAGGSWLSVSQGIAEDTSDLVSGFATIGDGLSESIDYPNEYWDSDEYEDDDDIGYTRQPIEDETWFLAHEIDYPSDNEKGTGNGSVPDPQEREQNKDDEDDQSFAEEDSYFSGERYFQSKNIDPAVSLDNPVALSATEMYRRNSENAVIGQYDGQLMDEEELNLMRAEPVWQGFVPQTNELIMLENGKVMSECGRPRLDDICMDDDQHGSVRSIGVGINSDAADIGSEVRESLIGGSSEGDVEYFHDQDASIGGSRYSQHDLYKHSGERSKDDKNMTKRQNSDKYIMSNDKGSYTQAKNHIDGGFSFPPPRDGQLWRMTVFLHHGGAKAVTLHLLGVQGMTNMQRWESANSSPSSLSNYGYTERECLKKEEDVKAAGIREEDPGPSLEDEEAAAVQEQVKQIKAQEEEFETFNLKIVHRKNRHVYFHPCLIQANLIWFASIAFIMQIGWTGFEEDKNFHVVLNSVIAGRYHVTEYLGSAAFSKAIQAHDLHTGMDVCVKIIKNNKDFFDQSLDEIKLLKYVNKHDPSDKYHLLRLYDYFYYREHLLIVCELLKANLYEFHKFNRESGGEVYFTMPRLQSITIQCLEALQFLHSLGLIHCDLKPENILVKSYSRCEVKVIDLGSSCFETDHLCSYVQSRSYRAPEVILGLPYDKKIDIWSLGCILAELCTGNVLFQNDSPATLLARVIGIISPIEQDMLAKGRDTYKYFTKNHMLYERNQETNRLEYLIPKKSSLRHRLPMGDQGFIDFVAHLLEINPKKRPSASEALKHPWLQYPYEPISS
ncbi:UNVERIFIED_CONTAM: putative serine/threonine-protein kinase dyrk2 [Sesamum radiatum]|uniref:Serine/threonine-protein kinase dyrk2 n=1 Tax=Sesamum radiatum TaxID=300843 RepID=A0AAW2RY94_SESRA